MDSLPDRHLRTLMAAPGLARAIRIGSRPSAKALASLEGLGLLEAPASLTGGGSASS